MFFDSLIQRSRTTHAHYYNSNQPLELSNHVFQHILLGAPLAYYIQYFFIPVCVPNIPSFDYFSIHYQSSSSIKTGIWSVSTPVVRLICLMHRNKIDCNQTKANQRPPDACCRQQSIQEVNNRGPYPAYQYVGAHMR